MELTIALTTRLNSIQTCIYNQNKYLNKEKTHLVCVRVLDRFPIQAARDSLVVDVADFIDGDNGRPDGCVRIKGFPHKPLWKCNLQYQYTSRFQFFYQSRDYCVTCNSVLRFGNCVLANGQKTRLIQDSQSGTIA